MSDSTARLPTGTVTFLFADLEGSTRLVRDLGDNYVETLDAYRGIFRDAIASNNGHELGTEGDSFFVVFASAPDAVRCAVEAQQAIAGRSWPEGSAVAARVGIHTGDAAPHENGYVGLAVHQAARVAAAANGGQILATDAVRVLSEDALDAAVDLADLGSHGLKDLDRPLHLFEVRHGDRRPGPPPRTLDARPHNLPVQATPFTGRETELREITKLVEDENVRLLTLTGPGGLGKTRLSLQAAAAVTERFPDGVWFVALAPVATAASVPSAIAQAIGAREVEDGSAGKAVLDEIAGKRMLLVLDNMEHVVDSAPFIAQLLAAAPDLSVLATSREALHVSAERVYPVPPMDVPEAAAGDDLLEMIAGVDAVALFVERAQAREPSFNLNASNAQAVSEICRRLDGLPLAIELAAARVSSLGVDGLLEGIKEGLSVLGGGPDDAPERHRTLEAAVAWSYDGLASREQDIIRALSIFAGTFEAEAAAAVADAAVPDLTVLVDRSLLKRESDAGPPRFSMLGTIRAFAKARLDRSETCGQVTERHTEYFRALAARADEHLHGAGAVESLDRLSTAHDDLRAVFERLMEAEDAAGASLLAASAAEFWRIRGHLEEGRQRLERAIHACPPGTLERARAIVQLARVRRSGPLLAGAPKDLAPMLHEASEAAERHGDTHTLAHALAVYATTRRDGSGRADKTDDTRGGEVPTDGAETAGYLAGKRLRAGRRGRDEKRETLERALALAEEAGDKVLAAEIRASPFLQKGIRNFMRAALGDPAILRESLDEAIARGDRSAEAEILLRRQTGDLRDRATAARRALELATDLGDRELAARSKIRLAEIANRRSDPAGAVPLFHEALELARETGAERLERDVLVALHPIAMRVGDRDAGRALHERAREVGARAEIALARIFSLEMLSERFPGLLTIAAAVAWAAAFFLPTTTMRAWLLAASGYAFTQIADTIAYRPRRWRKTDANDTNAVFCVVVAFGIGLWVQSQLVAALILFGFLGCFGPAGLLRGRLFGRGSKAVTVGAALAGAGASVWAPSAAPPIAMALMAWLGFRSVRDNPPADVAWALGRATAAVGRFAAGIAGADVFAQWRTAGEFRFFAWGQVAIPVAVGALAVFGLAVALVDRRLRFAGLALAVASVALPAAFVAAEPASVVAGVAFGAAWVLVGVLLWFEPRLEIRDVYPRRFRTAPSPASPRALA